MMITERIKNKSKFPHLPKLEKGEGVLLGILGVVILHSLWALSVGWNNNLLDQHSFRQTQTAISTYYMIQGSSWLQYETPVLGVPWSIPFEFPLYQGIVASLVKIFHTPLDQTGRLVSAIFLYLSLIPSYIILGCLKIPRYYRWIFLSLFLASPLYLFWSRTFMIESTALFLSLAYLAATAYYCQQKRLIYLLLASGFGILAAVVKVTTFLSFLMIAIFWILIDGIKSKNKSYRILLNVVISLVLLVLLPYIALWIWTHFADSQKILNPLAANFITSKSLTQWNFGTWEQRISLESWKTLLERCFHDIWGNLNLAVIFLVLLPGFGQRKKVYVGSMLAFFGVVLIFTNLHIIHNYYQYANGIFVISALFFSLLGLWEKQGLWKGLAAGILALILVFQIKAYHVDWASRAMGNNPIIVETADKIRQSTNPQDVLLIAGLDWSPELPYYSQRRALMITDRNRLLKQDDAIKSAFENIKNYHIGAMIICNNAPLNKEEITALNPVYKFNKTWQSSNGICQVYLP